MRGYEKEEAGGIGKRKVKKNFAKSSKELGLKVIWDRRETYSICILKRSFCWAIGRFSWLSS